MFAIKNFKGSIDDLVKLLVEHNLNFSTLEISEIVINKNSPVVNSDFALVQKIRSDLLKLPRSSQSIINAIKIHREITNIGLKHSKEWIEANMATDFDPRTRLLKQD